MPQASEPEITSAASAAADLIAATPFPTGTAMRLMARLLAMWALLAERAPFDQLPPERREAWMGRWAQAQVPPLDIFSAGVRSIALTAYFAQAGDA